MDPYPSLPWTGLVLLTCAMKRLLHVVLCEGQSFRWHSLVQYLMDLHCAHAISFVFVFSCLPQAAHVGVLLTFAFGVLMLNLFVDVIRSTLFVMNSLLWLGGWLGC